LHDRLSGRIGSSGAEISRIKTEGTHSRTRLLKTGQSLKRACRGQVPPAGVLLLSLDGHERSTYTVWNSPGSSGPETAG
jgi:hypothetical protein